MTCQLDRETSGTRCRTCWGHLCLSPSTSLAALDPGQTHERAFSKVDLCSLQSSYCNRTTLRSELAPMCKQSLSFPVRHSLPRAVHCWNVLCFATIQSEMHISAMANIWIDRGYQSMEQRGKQSEPPVSGLIGRTIEQRGKQSNTPRHSEQLNY